MQREKVPAILTVLSGQFASQPEAFTCLTQLAEERGINVDLAEVDVIQQAANVRLAHYFRPAIVARIQELQMDDNTAVVVRPSALASVRNFPSDTAELRHLGRFAGEIIEAEQGHNWV